MISHTNTGVAVHPQVHVSLERTVPMPGILTFPTPWVGSGIPGDLEESGPLITPKPPFIPALKCAKVSVQCLTDNEKCENVLWVWQAAGNWTYAQLELLANTINTSWITNIIPLMNDHAVLTGVKAEDASSQTGPVFQLTNEPQVPGTGASVAAPASLCIGIGFKTGLKGRSNEGRFFSIGAMDADFILGFPADASRVAWGTGFSNVLTDINTGGWQLAVVSFRGGSRWRTTAQVTSVILLAMGEFIYTQRRRLPGHNRHR